MVEQSANEIDRAIASERVWPSSQRIRLGRRGLYVLYRATDQVSVVAPIGSLDLPTQESQPASD